MRENMSGDGAWVAGSQVISSAVGFSFQDLTVSAMGTAGVMLMDRLCLVQLNHELGVTRLLSTYNLVVLALL